MNTVVFTIDEKDYKLKIMFAKQKPKDYFGKHKTVDFREFHFSADCIHGTNIDYDKIFSQTLALFLAEENLNPAAAIYVLPDKYVFFDYIETPTLSGKRLSDVLKLEIATRYPQNHLYRTPFVPFNSQNGKTASIVYMVRNDQITAINNALKPFKFITRAVTFESAMIANAYLALRPQGKRETTLFADVRENETKVIAMKDGKLLGFASIPFGKDLSDLESRVRSAPPVLYTDMHTESMQTVFDYVEDDDSNPKGNVRYLVRAITEMRDILTYKYGIENISIKYNVNPICVKRFSKYKEMERINAKHNIFAENLAIYGGAATKIHDKGLLFS